MCIALLLSPSSQPFYSPNYIRRLRITALNKTDETESPVIGRQRRVTLLKEATNPGRCDWLVFSSCDWCISILNVAVCFSLGGPRS